MVGTHAVGRGRGWGDRVDSERSVYQDRRQSLVTDSTERWVRVDKNQNNEIPAHFFIQVVLYHPKIILENHVMKELKEQLKTIDEYIRTFPEEVQTELKKMKKTIQEAAPEATEAIRYQMPTFRLNGKNLVHFAAFKNHIGFYPIPSGIEAFKKELSIYKQGKGSVQFPLDKPVPYELVKKIVKFRVAENMKKSKSGY